MRAGSTQKDSDPPGDLARVDHEGLQRDAMWRESSPAVTEEDATQFEQVRALARSRMDWFDEQESRWFSPEYSTFRDRGEPQTRLFFISLDGTRFISGLNNWRDFFPNLEDLPAGWPFMGLDHGLKAIHLTPTCKSFKNIPGPF